VKKTTASIFWFLLAVAGAWAYATLAFHRGEPLNSAYILIAALCTYALGYRFYSRWIAVRVLMLDDRRATPCEVHDDGKDFCRTNRWIVFGHHFAAISGPGPLVGPVLASQFGYLPGTLWILIGVVLGGAVQDFVILFCSLRRNGKSLGQMVKEELNSAAGFIALLAILAILVILLAVLALVVVRALAESPWGIFTVGATIPIAMLMGGYMRFWRVGKVLEASAVGVVLLLLAVWGGKFVHGNADWAKAFTLSEEKVAWTIVIYGLAASVLPIWLLLAPRDYLSTFMKLGTIFLLALGIFVVLPTLHMPALTSFGATGDGPVFAGKLFPFCFITIACGAISGFHTLIASGTTPKIISRETHARTIGYGAMCLESLVAIMALIAACTLDPGVYLSMNVKGEAAATAAKMTSLGFPVSVEHMNELAGQIGEKSLFGRVGGAPTLAVGMASIFSKAVGGRWLDLWYHFAIMFEALFILTTIDAGTRAGRYLLQDLLGHAWKPLGHTRSLGANFLASVLLVSAWGYFLIQGVRDPLGGINSLWPLFGIANQMLAAIALCLATTVILKMTLGAPSTASAQTATESKRAEAVLGAPKRSPVFALVTLVPLVWLLAVTFTAGVQKIWHPDPRIGFFAGAQAAEQKRQQLRSSLPNVRAEELPKQAKAIAELARQSFNFTLDACVAGAFLGLVSIIVLISIREWILLLARRKIVELRETPPVWLPDYAVAACKPLNVFGLFALAFALARELSGEAQLERARHPTTVCEVGPSEHAPAKSDAQIYLETTEKRFTGVNRCC
jgi:carbon starvation protein